MEENELKENEVEESKMLENEVEENVEQKNEIDENEVKTSEKPKRDWERVNLGTKSKDIALLTFFGSTFIRSFSGYFARSQESQKLFISIYVYIPGILALLGFIIGIMGIIKSKAKWDSVIGILINLFLIVSSVTLFMQMKAAGY